jgi:hypoxanthine phosphoribosyltransferase
MEGTVGLYRGQLLSFQGDGASYLFPVYDPTECPIDWLVLAGLHCLKTADFLNEPWNPTVKVGIKLKLRISCDVGSVLVDLEDIRRTHGDSLNLFLKHERNIAVEDCVTITSVVYNEIDNPRLRALFFRRPKPWSTKIKGRRSVKQLYSYPQLDSRESDQSIKLSWEEYYEAIQSLADKLYLDDALGGFRPQLIIGISRGGMAVADFLSRLLKNTPVIGLWADRDYAISVKKVTYTPPGNLYNKIDLARIVKANSVRRILLVDDFCKLGGSLTGARRFVQKELNKLSPKVAKSVVIKTAVLAKEAHFDSKRKVKLDYCTHTDGKFLPYGRG